MRNKVNLLLAVTLMAAIECGSIRQFMPTGFSAHNSFNQCRSIGIGVRNGHAMSYDSNRRKVLVFGGADATQVCSDAWEWDGRCWNRLSTTGPGPRTFAALTYDSFRKRVVLFGGDRALFGKTEKDNKLLGDTWEWDGQKWLEIKVPGPLPRAEAAMTFDRKRRRVLLFGGYNRSGSKLNRLGDTWEWDGARW